jgi:hypothetical protein
VTLVTLADAARLHLARAGASRFTAVARAEPFQCGTTVKVGCSCLRSPRRSLLRSAIAVLLRPGAWPTLPPIGLRKQTSGKSKNAGCPWPKIAGPMKPRKPHVRANDDVNGLIDATLNRVAGHDLDYACRTCSSLSLCGAPHLRFCPRSQRLPRTTFRARAHSLGKIDPRSPTALLCAPTREARRFLPPKTTSYAGPSWRGSPIHARPF